MKSLIYLAGLAAIAWFWRQSMRARETATLACKKACSAYNVQMLDGSVALTSMAMRWTADGLRLQRCYQFSFSPDGVDRQFGTIALLGNDIETIYFMPS